MSGHALALLGGGLGALGVGRAERAVAAVFSRESFLHLFIFAAILGLAYALNPSDRAFRAFLTDVSFRAHIRRLDDDTGKAWRRGSTERVDSPHVLTFTNRISVSLRTPSYSLKSYGFFSIARLVGPLDPLLNPALTVSGDVNAEAGVAPKDVEPSRVDHFIGAFGLWWTAWGLDGPTGGESVVQPRKDRLAAGVLAMERLDETTSAVASDVEDAHANTTTPKRRPQKAVIRGGKRVAPLKPPAHTRKSRSRSGSGAKALSPDAANVLSTQTDKDLPGLPFHTRDRSPAPSSTLAPSVDALSLVALRTQLDEINQAAEAREDALETELEGLRARKRDDDTARSDLKSRIRTADELRREAEHGKMARDRQRQALEIRVASLQRRETDLLAREKRTLDKRRNAERAEREAAAECAAEVRIADLTVARLAGRIEALEHQVDQRNADAILAAIKAEAPVPMLPPPGLEPPQWAAQLPSPQRSPQLGSAPASFLTSHPMPQSRVSSGPISAPHARRSPPVPTGTTSFFEHRLQHQSSTPSPPLSTAFAPFPSSTTGPARNLALPFFMASPPLSHQAATNVDTAPSSPIGHGHGASGPLSPLTPHQSSLIPSHLLDGLDDDDDVDRILIGNHAPSLPSSPTPGTRTINPAAPADLLGLSPDGPGRLAWSRAVPVLNPGAKAFDFHPSSSSSSTVTPKTVSSGLTPADLWESMPAAVIAPQPVQRRARGTGAFHPFDP